jgi:hypothetical protein
MKLNVRVMVGTTVLILLSLAIQRHSSIVSAQSTNGDLVSMQLLVLDQSQITGGGYWKNLAGIPLIAMEYATQRSTGAGGRTLYLYDGRSGDCKTIIRAPASAGQPLLVSWAPCN